MVCKKCQFNFCVYCRNEKSQCKNFDCNPFKVPFKFSEEKSICLGISVSFILLIISPLLALFFVPYIVMRNVYFYYNTQELSISNEREYIEAKTTTQNSLIAPKKILYNTNNKRSCLCLYFIIFISGLLSFVLSPVTLFGIIIILLVGIMGYIIN